MIVVFCGGVYSRKSLSIGDLECEGSGQGAGRAGVRGVAAVDIRDVHDVQLCILYGSERDVQFRHVRLHVVRLCGRARRVLDCEAHAAAVSGDTAQGRAGGGDRQE